MWSPGFYDPRRAPRPNRPKQIRMHASTNFKETQNNEAGINLQVFIVNNGATPLKKQRQKQRQSVEMCLSDLPV